MKKIIAVLLSALFMISLLASCAGQTSSSEKTDTTDTSDNSETVVTEEFSVGICNYVDDASLNQIVENIQLRLEEIGKERGVKFNIVYDNCNADANLLAQIIADFQVEDVDLNVAITTPVAVAFAADMTGTPFPLIFAAVSDPVSVGIVESLENPISNFSGTSDYLNTDAIMDIICALNKDVKKIGLLYDMGQDSSATAIEDAKAYLDSKNIEYVEKTGTTVDEVYQAAQQLVNEGVDAVFTPTDNTIMKSELSIYELFAEAKIPHFAGADSFALNGAFLGYGVDYIELGRETADMIAEVLIDGKSPSEMPVRTLDNGTATINTEICEALGLDFDTVSAAIAPYCTKVEKIVTAETFDGQK